MSASVPLTAEEKAVWEALSSGGVTDKDTFDARLISIPRESSTKLSGALLAKLLRALAENHRRVPIVLKGIDIVGHVDLDDIRTTFTLELYCCVLIASNGAEAQRSPDWDDKAFTAKRSLLHGLIFKGCEINGSLVLDSATIATDCFISQSKVKGDVRFPAARILRLDLRGSTFGSSHAPKSIVLDHARVIGSANISGCAVSDPSADGRSTIYGHLSIRSAKFLGGFNADAITVKPPAGPASKPCIQGAGLIVAGNFSLRRANIAGACKLQSSRIYGDFVAEGCNAELLTLAGSLITGDVLLGTPKKHEPSSGNDRFTSFSRLNLAGCKIRGRLAAIGIRIDAAAELKNPPVDFKKRVWTNSDYQLPDIKNWFRGSNALFQRSTLNRVSKRKGKVSRTLVAINAENARIDRGCNLKGSYIVGEIRFRNTLINGLFSARELVALSASLHTVSFEDGVELKYIEVGGGKSINAEDAKFKGDLICVKGLIGGLVDFCRSRVGGKVSFQSTWIVSAIDSSFLAIRAQFGSWELDKVRAYGHVTAAHAEIVGEVSGCGACIFGGVYSWVLYGCSIGGEVDLSGGAILYGTLRLTDGRLGKLIDLSKITIIGSEKGSVEAYNCSFENSLIIDEDAELFGNAVFDRSNFKGALRLKGARLASAYSAMHSHKLFLSVEGDELRKLKQSSDFHTALSLKAVSARSLVMPVGVRNRPLGIVDLTQCHAASFDDDRDAWPRAGGAYYERLILNQFRYDYLVRISGVRDDTDIPLDGGRGGSSPNEIVDARTSWLERQWRGYWEEGGCHGFLPEPWIQLSERLSSQGYFESAREIDAIRRRRQAKSRHTSRQNRFIARWLGRLAYFGHRPFRSVIAATIFWASFAVLWSGADWFGCNEKYCAEKSLFVRNGVHSYSQSKPGLAGETYPAFNAAAYSLDVLIPFVDLGYQSAWTVNTSHACICRLEWHELGGDLSTCWRTIKRDFGWPGQQTDLGGSMPDRPQCEAKVQRGLPITWGFFAYALYLFELTIGFVVIGVGLAAFSGVLERRD